MISKYSETEIGDQSEGQRSSQPLPLTTTSDQNGDPACRNLKMRLRLGAISSHFIILSGSGIKEVYHYLQVSMGS